jgi:predicted GIY-YIG superfamily endonuclease
VKRLVHIVDSPGVDLELAIALEHTVRALCGRMWVPSLSGDELAGIPSCTACSSLDVARRPKSRGPRKVDVDRKPNFVYRCYDSSGRLIYVGCTVNPGKRMKEHGKSSWWADQVAVTRVIVFPDRRYALLKEREAIGEERPRWNVKGRWPYRDERWTAEDYVDFRHAIIQAIETTHGVYGTRSAQLFAEIDAELAARFGVTALSRRPA